MEEVEGHGELTNHDIVVKSTASSQPEATKSFSVSDNDILRTQGHEAVLKRSFSIVTSLGFAFKNMTLAIGICTAVPLLAVLMVSMKDMDQVMKAGMPAVELLYQATGSTRVTVALNILWTIIYGACLPPQWVTCGRLAWAFARDRGTPFPDFFDKIDKQLEFPLRTTIASTVFAAIYGLIYLASTTAFNSIITSAVTLLNLSYAIPQAILVTRGRAQCLPKRPHDLGRWGYICNVFAPLWITAVGVMVCFPPNLPVALDSMNYSAPVMVGLFLIILVSWGLIGDEFKGPNIDWEVLNLKNEDISHTPTDIVEPNISL
ncbi:hypothetical protein PENVUL_c001G10241 [Penicillium vulpinum]|uniref:Amino acid permease/ SLC12A domain-containing protein n=1 Tax=Penicillium vulpinum TaxID=29845 RepID=A0A1V6SDQ9_9EURO|nr:hypothetical protein PENVUL_c001G10241 [Penicillium vulpinum]